MEAVGRLQLLELVWIEQENFACENFNTALCDQVTLAHLDESKRLAVYTDASDFFWSGIVIQVPFNDRNLPHADKRHEQISFLSEGSVSNSCAGLH